MDLTLLSGWGRAEFPLPKAIVRETLISFVEQTRAHECVMLYVVTHVTFIKRLLLEIALGLM